MIERWRPEKKDWVVFRFFTKEEGREALKMAIDLVIGECGDFWILPGRFDQDALAEYGYVGFAIRGDTNALSRLTAPPIRRTLRRHLGISGDELDAMLAPHRKRDEWFKKPPNE